MEEKNYSGMSVAGVLQLIFIVLKLIGVISWSWVWVLAPLWISFGIIALLILALLIVKKAKGL